MSCDVVEYSRAVLDEKLVDPAGMEPIMARHRPELAGKLLLRQLRRLLAAAELELELAAQSTGS